MSQLDFQIGLLENPEEMRNCKKCNLLVFPEKLYGVYGNNELINSVQLRMNWPNARQS